MAKTAAPETAAPEKVTAAESPILPVVGQEVLYCPNGSETYRGTVTAVNADFSVELAFTNASGSEQKIVVPHKSKAEQITFGPHWVEEPK